MPTLRQQSRDEFDFSGHFSVGDDTLREEHRGMIVEILHAARRWWDGRQDFRDRRLRSRNYRRGKQWYEEIDDPDRPGKKITEEEYIKRQRRLPWKINQIDAIMRNLRGQYYEVAQERLAFAVDAADEDTVRQLNMALKAERRENDADMLEADELDEHIMSGACAFRVDFEWNPRTNRNHIVIDRVDQNRLFYNMDINSRTMRDLRIVGYLHDMTLDDIITQFAVDDGGEYSESREDAIREIYADRTPTEDLSFEGTQDVDFEYHDAITFLDTASSQHERVIEVWWKRPELVRYMHDTDTGDWFATDATDAEIAENNRQRAAIGMGPLNLHRRREDNWWVFYLTPEGDILFANRSPYGHESHPYIIGLAQLLDGESWGLIEQIIDPQRWLNRLIALIDHSVISSAKGVLVIDEDIIPADMDINDVADVWSDPSGVLRIKARPGKSLPTQITENAVPVEVFSILTMLRDWIDQTSGVTGPVSGQDPAHAGTPAALFQMQISQASATNRTWFRTYFETLRELDRKVAQTIMQAYREPTVLSDGAEESVYDPERVLEFNYDFAVADVDRTATMRLQWEQQMQQFLMGGLLDFETYLQMSGTPAAHQLLRFMRSRSEQGGDQLLQQPAAQITAGGQSLAAQAA